MRPLLHSVTGAFGFNGAFCEELEELVGAVERRASVMPPAPVASLEEDEDVEPVTVDMNRDDAP